MFGKAKQKAKEAADAAKAKAAQLDEQYKVRPAPPLPPAGADPSI